MTAHPAWPQSQYDQKRAGLSAPQLRSLRVVDTKSGGPGRAVKESQEGIPDMHFAAKKVIVVGGSAGMGRQVAIDVVDHGGSAVIVGEDLAIIDGASKDKAEAAATEKRGNADRR
jgi:hypothetical protein